MLTSDASECLRVHRNSSIAMKMATIKPQIRTTKIPPMFSIPRPGREHKQHKLLGKSGKTHHSHAEVTSTTGMESWRWSLRPIHSWKRLNSSFEEKKNQGGCSKAGQGDKAVNERDGKTTRLH